MTHKIATQTTQAREQSALASCGGSAARNCNGCENVTATYGEGWTQIRGREERRAFVQCKLFGRVFMSKHWGSGACGETQPESYFPPGCPRTQRELNLVPPNDKLTDQRGEKM